MNSLSPGVIRKYIEYFFKKVPKLPTFQLTVFEILKEVWYYKLTSRSSGAKALKFQ